MAVQQRNINRETTPDIYHNTNDYNELACFLSFVNIYYTRSILLIVDLNFNLFEFLGLKTSSNLSNA